MRIIQNNGYQGLLYELPNGKSPVNLFLDKQSAKMVAKFISRIDLLEKNGPNLREPFSKILEDGIYELRFQTEGNQARILYFFTNSRQVILTNGFIKKTEKTPPEEIAKAKRYRSEFLRTNERKQK